MSTSPVRAALNHWFRRPPRLHGEVDHERTVSFLELLYDLVFVVLISQVAHTLAAHPSWSGLADFVVVFSLIWIAWLNGSLHHEGHGREDGRGRGNIFGQMGILVVLAVFTAHATTTDGTNFAVTYTVLLAWIAWQWNTVRYYDVIPMYRRIAGRYIAMLVVSATLMLASAFIDEWRFVIWVGVAVLNVLVPMLDVRHPLDRPLGLVPTESMAERFGLLTIITLGELVVGVVNGINETNRGFVVIGTALLALGVGFGFWWNYFDLIGRRPPRATYRAFLPWVLLHLPLTMVIAGAGAGMVGLIAHASQDHAPVGSGWLLAGSSAALLLLIALITLLIDYPDEQHRAVMPLARRLLSAGVVASLVVGVLMPAPWLLALLLFLIHAVVWFSLFVALARHTDLFTRHDGPADA